MDKSHDSRLLDKITGKELVTRYITEELQDGGRRRGAAEDRRGHMPAILNDFIAGLPLSQLYPAAAIGFRNRQAALHRKATVVKRLILIAGIISNARSEWHIPMPENPASAASVKRSMGADKKRKRRLMVPTGAEIRDALEAGLPPPRHEKARLLDAVTDPDFPHDLPLVKWSIAQATRQGEALAIRRGDLAACRI